MANRPKARKMTLQLGSQDEGSSKANQLQSLLGHYNSDDDDEEEAVEESSEQDKAAELSVDKPNIDGQFQDFMKEISSMEDPSHSKSEESLGGEWQELWDPQSGFPYYWNTKTNELTWDRPKVFLPSKTAKPDTPQNTPNMTKTESQVRSLPSKPAQDIVTKGSSKSASDEATNIIGPKPKPLDVELKVDKENEAPLTSRKDLVKRLDVTEKRELSVAQKLPSIPLAVKEQLYDVDAIIAEIEKEVPPDAVVDKNDKVVPLFKRRKFTEKPEVGPKLNFKNYFSANSLPLFTGDDEREAFAFEQPTDLSHTKKAAHFGLGYSSEEVTESNSRASTEIQFIKGDVLKPVVAEETPEPVVPKTFQERLTDFRKLLEEKSQPCDVPEPQKILIQLEVLLEVLKEEVIPESYVEKWLKDKEESLRPDEKSSEKEPLAGTEERMGDNLLVENMELADSDNEVEETVASSQSKEKIPDIDSALTSFYSDLATLES